MKYMTREYKEELYFEIRELKQKIDEMLNDERLGDTQTAEEYARLLKEAKYTLALLSANISDYIYHIVI